MSGIPRRMVCFWIGRMSWMRWLSLDTFVRLNPDWEVHLYTAPIEMLLEKHWEGTPDDDNSYTGRDYWDSLPPSVQVRAFAPPCRMGAAQMCDLFQWNALAVGGGVYADLDILWLKPLDSVFAGVADHDAVFCLERGMFAIGLVASAPECPLFMQVVDYAAIQPNTDYQHYGSSLFYRFTGLYNPGANPGDEIFKRLKFRYQDLRIAEIPDRTVYPFDWRETGKIFVESFPVPKGATGLHWFGGCPRSDEFNNRITEGAWQDHDNTFTNCLRTVL